jgi:hypothetical protein
MATAKKSSKKAQAAAAPAVAEQAVEQIIDFQLLKQINDATMSAAGMLYVSQAESLPLLNQQLVEINANFVDAEGRIATRITQKGIEEMSKHTQAHAPAIAAVAAIAAINGFAIVDGIEPPVSRRGSGNVGDKKYPFDALKVGQSFFVPASEQMPEPWKKLGSTVSSATARYAVETGETRTNRSGEVVPKMKPTRRFVLRKVDDGAPWGHSGKPGAAIFRLADEE